MIAPLGLIVASPWRNPGRRFCMFVRPSGADEKGGPLGARYTFGNTNGKIPMSDTEDLSPPDQRGWGRYLASNSFVAFLGGMFAWSWGYWAVVGVLLDPNVVTPLVTLPGLWGPPLSAIGLCWATGRSVRYFLGHRLRLGGETHWYAIAVFGPVGLGCVAALVQGMWLGLTFEVSLVGSLLTLGVALFAGGLEELGLRGFAHEQLRDRYGTFWTGILIGIPWALWHFPLQWLGIGFQGPFVLFAGGAIGWSVLLGWLYDQTEASVLPVIIAHAAVDVPPVISPAGTVPADIEFMSQIATLTVIWGLAVGVLWAEVVC